VFSVLLLVVLLASRGAGQQSISVGAVVTGSLTSASPVSARRQGAYAAYYTFAGQQGQNIHITLLSDEFDTYLYLEGPGGTLVGENDDNGLSSNSRIPAGTGMLALPASGIYTIEVTSFSAAAFGTYTLRLEGDCLPPPRGAVRFDVLEYVTNPNLEGIRLLAGQRSSERVAQTWTAIRNLPLPAFPNQRFCGGMEVAPGVRAEVFVPTAAERNGDYSQTDLTLWDWATRTVLPDGSETMYPFPGNMVPVSRQDATFIFAWRLAELLPSLPAPSPPSPAAGSTAAQTFTFRFTSVNGHRDLGVLNILLNDFLDGRHACYLAYVPSQKVLYMVNDEGNALLPGLPLGSSGTLGNSQCTVFGAGSSAEHVGHNITLRLAMSFHSGFAGNRIWYLAARDALENTSGWHALGTWSVPPATAMNPRVTSLSPLRGSGPRARVTFQFADDNGWQNLGVVNMLLNDFLDGRQACYLAYARPINVLYLVNDAGNGLLPGLFVNGSGTLFNHQCTISNPVVSGSGNTLTLNMDVEFSEAFVGDRIWYLAASDISERNSGWQAVGSWTIE
jgi:hypothetical protein